MKQGDTEHIGGGLYLHFDGSGFDLEDLSHENPADTSIYIEWSNVPTLLRLILETTEGMKC